MGQAVDARIWLPVLSCAKHAMSERLEAVVDVVDSKGVRVGVDVCSNAKATLFFRSGGMSSYSLFIPLVAFPFVNTSMVVAIGVSSPVKCLIWSWTVEANVDRHFDGLVS